MNLLKDVVWYLELTYLMKIFLAFLAGGAIGLEREKVGKDVGIRTYGLICAGACAYTSLSELFSVAESLRVVANVVVAMGFLAGGVIYRSGENKVSSHGLTTASSLWVTPILGIMVGYGMYILAFGFTLLILFILHIPSAKIWRRFSKKHPF